MLKEEFYSQRIQKFIFLHLLESCSLSSFLTRQNKSVTLHHNGFYCIKDTKYPQAGNIIYPDSF